MIDNQIYMTKSTKTLGTLEDTFRSHWMRASLFMGAPLLCGGTRHGEAHMPVTLTDE